MVTVANVHRAITRCCYFVSFSLIIYCSTPHAAPWALDCDPGLPTEEETETLTKKASVGGLPCTRIKLDPLTQEHTFPSHPKGSFFPTHQESARGTGSMVVTSTDLEAITQEELTWQAYLGRVWGRVWDSGMVNTVEPGAHSEVGNMRHLHSSDPSLRLPCFLLLTPGTVLLP